MKLKEFVKTYFGITKYGLRLHLTLFRFFENDVTLIKSDLLSFDYYLHITFIKRDNQLSNFCKSRGIRYMSDEQTES